jgi:glycosyltransferase involved in cell wall biosynthesis
MKSILILFHCESNTGYAIARLEPTFFNMALNLCNSDASRIHIAYTSMAKGRPQSLPASFDQYLIIDTKNPTVEASLQIKTYLQNNHIDTIFGFDQPVHQNIYKYFRAGGVKHLISYWGAPISSIFGPLKRALKRLDVLLHWRGPDHYIFESQGMAETAVFGRGIPEARVHIAYLGVNTNQFRPEANDHLYIYNCFNIPPQRKIFFYSGHMEPRKGVATIMRAANHLATTRTADDWHIVILGNQPGEENELQGILQGEPAKARVTFGGYRNDIEILHRGCYAGIIASTGWDSLTCSSLEMQSSGLPLLLSDLPGLREAGEDNKSCLLCPPGDYEKLAQTMRNLLDNQTLRNKLSVGARVRAEKYFSEQVQLEKLVAIMRTATV